MGELLFKSANRDEAHAELERLHGLKRVGESLEQDTKALQPLAECRENPNSDEPFEVWDSPEPIVVPEPPSEEELATARAEEIGANEALLDALADRLAVRLAEAATRKAQEA